MKRASHLLSALLVVVMSLSALADTSAESQASAARVRDMMALIHTEFINEVPSAQLVNGALDGVEAALEEKKIAHAPLQKVAPEDEDKAFSEFEAQFHPLTRDHPELLEDNWLAYEAIKGMLKTLGDDYTVFLDPDEYSKLKESMSGGNFGGLGVYIELDKNNENRLTVVEPIEDTPAAEAGLKPRDIILKIDGESTVGYDIQMAQTKLRGPIGSEVVLTIRRVNQAEPFDVHVKRDRIHVNSVRHQLIEENGKKIGYVRLRMFGEDTNEELEAAMRELEHDGAEAFIMDLRNNGGGYIISAVDVCSKFLPTGSKVVSVQERGAPNTKYLSRPNVRKNLPLVLLVNEFSASASEITAAAMQDLHRAKLVGVKTFGKGSVQKIFPLPDGSALKVTTAHYHTPAGHDINKIGVDPDVLVKMEGKRLLSSDDNQLKAAVDVVEEELKVDQANHGDLPTARSAVRIFSVEQELAYLRSLGKRPEVLERRVFEEDGQLVEELKVKFADGSPRTVRLDISDYLGR
ncbi:MAG: PDZ domain-containing protein [Candidatus Eremiobacteraeota bacterium]|nr:PDZ domain-containing protein [Candidatus Eremiobacteraeota bacterium]